MFNKIINTAYSFGAAIVVFGAWGKIEHKAFGSLALTIGLLTEVAIFLIYGFMEWKNTSEQSNQPMVQDQSGMKQSIDQLTNRFDKIFKI